MSPEKTKLLGKLLLERGVLSERQLSSALDLQQTLGKPLNEVLVDMGLLQAEEIERILADRLERPPGGGRLIRGPIAPEIIAKVPARLAKIYRVVPVGFEAGSLSVAMADPGNLRILDDLRFRLGVPVRGILAAASEIASLLETHYGAQDASLRDVVDEMREEERTGFGLEAEDLDTVSLKELAQQAPVTKLLNLILVQGVKDQASDIHFEPFEHEFKIRYRVDGTLYELEAPPKSLALPITSRIKVMAGLDIAERRLPQDGRMQIKVGGRTVDVRVSTLPTAFGESVVLRLLDRSSVALNLEHLGLSRDLLSELRQLILRPNGIVLTTGPTGSGKTTTLYAAVSEINKPGVKIITTEDPVEYEIDGIVQVPVNPKIELDFARCLRSILRQDPDIVLVGEIRDEETAQIAVQASLTGHLVFSSLHTNDAPSAITRLLDMGIEPFLITSSLEAVLAQRLVRKICAACREPYRPTADLVRELGLSAELVGERPFHAGKGCKRCGGIGYHGRTAIGELLILNDPIRQLILERAPAVRIRRLAEEQGMKSLRDDGIMKILSGVTTPEEVIRETQRYV